MLAAMMNALSALPMMARVLASLAMILVCNGLVRNLAASVLVGTVLLALFTGQPAAASARIGAERLFSLDNAYLMLVILLVISLSTQMSEAGVMRDLVSVVRRRLGRRHAMVALPALIGFLPMPGGAIFSAPLVESCDPDGAAAPVLKARANFWFRHIWESWWPLYPGILLAMHLTGVEVWQFMLLGLPLTFAALAGGHLFLLRRIPDDTPETPAGPLSGAPSLARLLAPILAVIAGYALHRLLFAALRAAAPGLPAPNRYVPMIFGILLAVFLLERWRPLPRTTWRRIVFSTKTLNMALIVAAVRIYGAFIEAPLPGGGTPVALMQAEMARWGIPVIAMVMLLPFIAGLTTGLAIGFVGASFPIVVSLMGPNPALPTVLAFTVLAYGCGHMGQMLSPVHVCLIVTNEHFKTNLFHSLRGLLAPAATVVLTALAVYSVITRW